MKSPLKDKPFHNPGQSSDEYIQNYRDDKILSPLLFAFGMIILAIMEWYKSINNSPPAPILMTALAIIASIKKK